MNKTKDGIFEVIFKNGDPPLTVEAAEFSYDVANGADAVNFHRANGSVVADISVRASDVANIRHVSAPESAESDNN